MSISSPRKPLLAVVAIFALFAAACNQESNGVAAPSGSISEMVSAAQRAAAVPGLVAGVITSTEVQTAAAGLRKAGGSPALSTSDRMHLGSNIKAMTATLVATLVENGVLRWTTTITEVFPEFATTTRAEYGAVTVEQLLAHRGGILPLDDRASFNTCIRRSGATRSTGLLRPTMAFVPAHMTARPEHFTPWWRFARSAIVPSSSWSMPTARTLPMRPIHLL